MVASLPLLFLLSLLTPSPKPVTSELVLEPGYSVSTVADFSKPPSTIYPFALLPRPRSNDLILLDSTNSAFYSLPIPISQGNEVSLFSGKGVGGFSDGDRTAAMFQKPRSFAIDSKDNVYVADRSNYAIRKISSAGVTTTIAGGHSNKSGHIDGPAQDASFSNDFELVFVPKICALLISDRGNRLIRQMNLKPEDCAQKSESGLGAVPVSFIAILCALVGSVFGFVARPYFASRELCSSRCVHKTWKHYQTKLERLALTSYSAIRSAVANSTFSALMFRLLKLSLCYLSVVFRNIRLERRVQYGRKTPVKANDRRQPISLLDSDMPSDHSMLEPQVFSDRLEDLISFDEGTSGLEVNMSSSEQKLEMEECSKGSSKIDDMITSNLLGFDDQGSKGCKSTLVQRRMRPADGL